MLKKTGQPIYLIKAHHNCAMAANLSSEEYGGLEPLIRLAVGARVMLTRNMWIHQACAMAQ